MENEADESRFSTLIKSSQVLHFKEEYNKWNWDSILEIVETYLVN